MNDADRKAFEEHYKDTEGCSPKFRTAFKLGWEACSEWRDSQAGEPIGWRVAFTRAPRGNFQEGKPDNQTVEYWGHRGIDFEYCYAAPPTAQINQRLVEALDKLHAVVIAKNRAGADWGEQFTDLMVALSLAQSALNAAKSGDV